MKDKFLPILLAGFLLASCSSVYKSGQTPDDVYYSPTKSVVKTEDKEDEKVEDKTADSEDQYLKMKVRNRYRWTSIDDYDYWNDTRYNHCNCQCNNSFGYGYYYNPYTPIRTSWSNPYVVFGGTRNIKTSTSSSNVKAYTNTTYNNTNTGSNPKTGTTSQGGSLLKRVFTSSGTSVDRSQRTFGSGSTSSGSSSTSSSAGGKSGGMNTTGSGGSSGKSRGN
jgi:hypothetical protein